MDQGRTSTNSSEPIRILFVDLPPLLIELLQISLADEPNIKINGSMDGNGLLQADPLDTDIVLLGVQIPDTSAELCEQILGQFPYLKIMTISLFNNEGNGYWLDIEHYRAGRLDTDNLYLHFQHLFNLKPSLRKND
jgi:hypothetical protein